ncbi:DUF3310 domain-containing protein [Thauera aromatica]|uniref:DUF3310 domain-containing protein n=1 Tax=Thauera aromatica TaxID=59405 RepID=UPI001FFDC564|nr:DUF3310 domain-containing protein [Thauera aromatica]MCK2086955.1 DUF3310 domain-containing protein [Thauera aromatica]
MSTRKKPAPLREQIVAFLKTHDEATLKQIAASTTERDFPSRVITELNKMRTDALIECAKKKGKNELWYWLAATEPQPEVGKNTGSRASVPTSHSAEGAAVRPEPTPQPTVQPVAAVAEDEPAATPEQPTAPPLQYDPNDVAFSQPAAPAKEFHLLGVLADIRAAIGDSGQIMLGELAEHIRAIHDLGEAHKRACIEWEKTMMDVFGEDGVGDVLMAIGKLKDDLRDAHLELAVIRELLAERIGGEIDPSDMSESEIARAAAQVIDRHDDELVEQAKTIIDLRGQLDAGGADMVNHPPHYQGKVECIEAIEAALGGEGFAAYCRGNAIKYTFRAGRKGDAAVDLAKARWYLERVAA